jgi:hypothetical protein
MRIIYWLLAYIMCVTHAAILEDKLSLSGIISILIILKLSMDVSPREIIDESI